MKIKILYIISDKKFGGGSRHLLDLMHSLDKNKFEPVLISIPSPILDRVDHSIKSYDVEMKSRLDLKSVKTIQNIISIEKPKIIHLHSTRAGLLGTYAAKNLHIPIIYTEHLFTEEYIPHSKLIHHVQIYAFKKLSKYITKVIAVSESVKKFLVSENIFPTDKIDVIYHGIQTNKQNIHDNTSRENITIGSIGALNKLKGQEYLIKALNDPKLKELSLKLEIVGTGSDEARLKELSKTLDLDKNIKFLGQIDNVEEVMKNWDIYVQPSLSESFGLAAAEAMSMEIPVIATDTSGLKELIDQNSGLLVEPKNPEALASAIIKLVLDSKLRRTLGLNAKIRIENHFSLENMINKTETLYEKILKLRN